MSELVSPPSDAALPQDPGPDTQPSTSPVVPAQAGAVEPRTTGTTAGTVFAGRYRLTTRVGTDPAAGAEFWQAVDTVLRRDVAVTVLRRLGLDSAGADPGWSDRAEEMVSRALRSGSFEHRGCARLLDVLTPDAAALPNDVLGVAVTEWVPGRSLAEAVSAGLLRPLTAARALVPLAGAAEAAHVHGLVLGCDHPQRIRITPDGRAQVGFAMPRPETTPADDVRGLGAVLYALLTAQWPLSRSDAARAGLDSARRDATDVPVPPSTQRPGVPVELDTIAAGTLGPETATGHVHTAASVRALLDQVVEEDDRIALFPPVRDGVPAEPGDVWQEGGKRPAADPRRRRKLALGLVALGVAVVAVLGFVGSHVVSMFTTGNPAIVVPGPVANADPQPSGPQPAGVRPLDAEVYDKAGDGDNRDQASRVVDRDPNSAWRTADYKQQFPAFKPGIGVVVSFESAVQLADLTIDSPSAGTVVEIRSIPSVDAPIEQTTVIGSATLRADATQIALPNSQPVTHVLVWITKLSGPGGELNAQINEITFHRAGG
ncbi:protein kinase family protein [Pseudonocardia sp. CA-107938]|uniref:protein kinase family protein n=1 Tax=Pseudonocardia sp. CA-107938 TaxID=3240021 RepID=UPI003D90C5F4